MTMNQSLLPWQSIIHLRRGCDRVRTNEVHRNKLRHSVQTSYIVRDVEFHNTAERFLWSADLEVEAW